VSKNVLKGKYAAAVLCCILTAGVLCGCSRSAEVEETSEILVIEVETEAEVESEEDIILMGLGEEILPQFAGVTTAENNAQLSPVYLKVGDSSPVVLTIQKVLMTLGYMDNDEPTTYYGEATSESVKKFQRQVGFVQDGIMGPETWDRLISSDVPYYQVKNGDDGTDIANIQQRLYQLGYLTADCVTGHFGDTTEAAVRKMQERNGIHVDGTVGKESINLLYSDEIVANLIGVGEESELVKAYQERLVLLNYLESDKATGYFGSATEAAVKRFQSINALIVDGYLGPDTRMTLESSEAKPFGLRLGDGGAELADSVIAVQKRLVHYGYLTSKYVTGYYGDLTKNAVLKFQECNGLYADGVTGKQTMAKLNSDSAVKKPANVEVKASGTTQAATTQAAGQATQPATAHASDSGSGNTGANSSVGSAPDTSGPAGSLIAIAYSRLGSRYVWGSKGPNSFDCSGFVYWCLNQSGVSQSYLTSSGWRNPGRYTKISDFDSIQAGDIVVVSGHVGIAAGNGTVIDASSSNGRVVHRSLSDWWRSNFIVAWRIF